MRNSDGINWQKAGKRTLLMTILSSTLLFFPLTPASAQVTANYDRFRDQTFLTMRLVLSRSRDKYNQYGKYLACSLSFRGQVPSPGPGTTASCEAGGNSPGSNSYGIKTGDVVFVWGRERKVFSGSYEESYGDLNSMRTSTTWEMDLGTLAAIARSTDAAVRIAYFGDFNLDANFLQPMSEFAKMAGFTGPVLPPAPSPIPGAGYIPSTPRAPISGSYRISFRNDCPGAVTTTIAVTYRNMANAMFTKGWYQITSGQSVLVIDDASDPNFYYYAFDSAARDRGDSFIEWAGGKGSIKRSVVEEAFTYSEGQGVSGSKRRNVQMRPISADSGSFLLPLTCSN